MPPRYQNPTGEVFIRNFDEGVVKWFGGSVQLVNNRKSYFISLPACSPPLVPIIWNNPEQVYDKKIYPSFEITRESFEPDMSRWHSVLQMEYRAGVPGTEQTVRIGNQMVSGYGQTEQKVQAEPFNIFYTISAYARYEHEAIPMIKQILRRFPKYSRIFVIDSLGESRSYTVFQEGGSSDIGEYVDVADRLKAYSISIRVEGELDLSDPVVMNTVLEFQNTVGIKK